MPRFYCAAYPLFLSQLSPIEWPTIFWPPSRPKVPRLPLNRNLGSKHFCTTSTSATNDDTRSCSTQLITSLSTLPSRNSGNHQPIRHIMPQIPRYSRGRPCLCDERMRRPQSPRARTEWAFRPSPAQDVQIEPAKTTPVSRYYSQRSSFKCTAAVAAIQPPKSTMETHSFAKHNICRPRPKSEGPSRY